MAIKNYSDFYKKNNRTPGAAVEDDEEDTTTNPTTRPFKSRVPGKPTERVTPETEADRIKKAAIKRRLKLSAGKTNTTVVRRR